MYFSMVPTDTPDAAFYGPRTLHWTLVDNIKRDPFETAVGETEKTFQGMGGALGGPLTAYEYDWNILPLGQQLWLQELETYQQFPPLQNPETYNLSQVTQQLKAGGHHGQTTCMFKRAPPPVGRPQITNEGGCPLLADTVAKVVLAR